MTSTLEGLEQPVLEQPTNKEKNMSDKKETPALINQGDTFLNMVAVIGQKLVFICFLAIVFALIGLGLYLLVGALGGLFSMGAWTLCALGVIKL